jgi:hypothetical protein
MRVPAVSFAVSLCVGLVCAERATAEMARGVVFEDANANAVRDAGEGGIAGVLVSNGRGVVKTGADGAYAIEVGEGGFVFVVTPRGYATPVDTEHKPRFFYHHHPAGSPPLAFPGVAPTGPMPASIDFGMTRREAPESVRVILFGDPQPYTIDEVNYYARDIVPDVLGEIADPASPAFGATMGITLGDLVGDDLSLMGPLNAVTGTIGLPWHHVHGNHDMNFDASGDAHAAETHKRVYGPTDYAFHHGSAVFIVLDNVVYEGPREDGKPGGYHAAFSEDQLAFIRNIVAHSDAALVVVTMHIPLDQVRNRAAFLAALGDRPSVSISAHLHLHKELDLGADGEAVPHDHDGPSHHHIVSSTAGGSWWQGHFDEMGIPHTMMRDGAPNGWSVLEITGEAYSVRFKGARKEWKEQVYVDAPDEIDARLRRLWPVVATVYAGTERTVVEMRVVTPGTGVATEWVAMERFRGVDPRWARLRERQEREPAPEGKKLTDLNAETDLWQAMLPGGLATGGHVIEVRARDRYGREHMGRHVVRVVHGRE